MSILKGLAFLLPKAVESFTGLRGVPHVLWTSFVSFLSGTAPAVNVLLNLATFYISHFSLHKSNVRPLQRAIRWVRRTLSLAKWLGLWRWPCLNQSRPGRQVKSSSAWLLTSRAGYLYRKNCQVNIIIKLVRSLRLRFSYISI
jgi:hypothetical protein